MKNCRHCAHVLPGDVRRCSRCRSFQSWVASGEDPRLFLLTGALVLLLVTAAALVIILGSSHPDQREDRPMGGYVRLASSSQLEVLSSEFTIVGPEDDPELLLFGRIRNPTADTFDNVMFEIRCFDAAGTMIDGKNTSDHFIVLPPGKEGIFRLSARPFRERSAYSRCDAIVTIGSQWVVPDE